jgi:chemotaxis protein MotB
MKRQKKCPPAAPIWLTSWSDLTTLLLTFFILMFTTAEIDGRDFFLILSSFRGSLGMFSGGQSLSKGRLEEMGMNMMNLPSSEQGRALARQLRQAIQAFKPEIQSKKVRVTEYERGLVITLSGDAYFDPGSARLKDEIFPVLKKAADIMNSIPNLVRIEGHTDDTPVAPGGAFGSYETNWELSSMRSVNVVRHLPEHEDVNSKKLSVVAFAQYRPVDENNTPEGRAFNRRIDIVILREKPLTESTRKEYSKPLPDEEWR